MANRIIIKRGQSSNISNAELSEGELAVAYSADKSTADLYVGTGSGKAKINLKGKDGVNGTNGTNGADGKAATVEIGTVTTGAAGTSASVKNVGTATAAKLDITIPRGAAGAQGATGPQGPTGPQGATGATGSAGANGKDGTRGSVWNSGTAMSGTSSTTGYYSYSGASNALVGDYYLNTTYGYVYRCTTAGSGTSAKWTYQGSIRGATGATGSTGATAPSIYAQHGNCRNHAAFHYLKDN